MSTKQMDENVPDFDLMIEHYHERMATLRRTFDLHGRLLARSTKTPSYSILLTLNTSIDALFRVTSFDGKTPTGHREYSKLDGGGPTQNALSEFLSDDLRLVPPRKRDTERRTREAEHGLLACAEAITKTPDDAGKAIFERSQRIWQRRLDLLKLSGR